MRYFPPGIWGKAPNFHANLSEVVSNYLLDMDEYPLWQAQFVPFVYRLLWLRTFHYPISILVTETEHGAGEMIAKLLGISDEQGLALLNSDIARVKAGTAYYQATLTLSSDDYQTIQRAFEEADFWNMPSTDDHTGRDGSIWVLEAVVNEHYHAVMRWSPSEGVFRDVALTLLHMAAIPINPLY